MHNPDWQAKIDAVDPKAVAALTGATDRFNSGEDNDINVHPHDLLAGPDVSADPFANGKFGASA